MWDTVESNVRPLSHDLPCQACGHPAHTYLPCGDSCECGPTLMPGDVRATGATLLLAA